MDFLINNFATIFTALSFIATFVVRLTETESDDKVVKQVLDFIRKVAEFMPTLGKNPRTQRLEQELKKLKEGDASLPKPPEAS